MKVCLVGDTNDLTSVYFGWVARKKGFAVLDFDEATLGTRWNCALVEADKGVVASLRWEGNTIPLSDIAGAFLRFSPTPSLPNGLNLSSAAQFTYISERRAGLHYFFERAPFTVINRPGAGRSNGSKPLQMDILQTLGFIVPPWIATNDEMMARDFVRECKADVIYKACSGLRSKVGIFGKGMLAKFKDGTSPTILQEYIEGREIRVHVVGERTFGTETFGRSMTKGRRTGRAGYKAAEIPAEIAELCCKAAGVEELTLAGLDFRIDKENTWFCLEMNPVPTFMPYELATGQPIAEAILGEFSRKRRVERVIREQCQTL